MRKPLRSVVLFFGLLAAAILACGERAGGGEHLALVGVTVIDGLGNPPMADRAVVIRDGRIADVAPAAGFAPPRGATVVKLPGRFLMPGLVDLHAQVTPLPQGEDGRPAEAIDREGAERVLKTLLAFGITTVRDPTAPAAGGDALRDAVAAGEIPGPRIVTAGSPLSLDRAPFGRFAATGSLSDEVSLSDRIRWLETVDLEEPEVGATIAALAARRTAVDPTLIAFHARLSLGEPEHGRNLDLGLVAPSLRATWERSADDDGWTAEDFARARAAWPRMLDLTRKLYDGGVVLAAGSDFPRPGVIPGVSLHQGLRLLQDAGIPPLEVLKIATYHGAVALGLDGEIGSVEPGKIADLIVVGADPSVNLGNARAISHVFRGGRFFDPSALLEFWR